jgi:CelD/BcsL family acetyltransferase involved in cellulose biosynthesis
MLSVAGADMRLDLTVSLEPGFDFLSDEYAGFYSADRATAFQAPLWMAMIHSRLAGGLNATQQTLTLRNRADGALVAVIPLVLQRSKGIRLLRPADFGVCDYNSIVADRNMLGMIAADANLVAELNALVSGADILMFRKVREDDFDIGRLFAGSTSTPAENAAYHSTVGDDFDAWRSRTIRKKFSKELGRLQRQMEREFGSYEHRAAATEDEIRKAFDFLRASRSGRFEDDLLQSDLYFEFYRDYAIAAAERGEAVTYVSYVAGEPVAVLFGLVGDGEFHAVLIGSDTQRFGRSSPGTQIIYQIIKRRFEEGFRSFDMGLGNSGYKTHFRVEETALRNHTKTFSMAGYAMATVYHYAKPVKNLLRKFVPNVR